MSHIVESGYLEQEDNGHIFLEGSQEEELIIENPESKAHESQHIVVGTGTKGTAIVRKNYPAVDKTPISLISKSKLRFRGWGSL